MSLSAALSTTHSGLAHVQRQMAQAAHDIANAATAGHTRKRLDGVAGTVAGGGGGVISKLPSREVDAALAAEALNATSAAAGAGLREEMLAAVDRVHGSVAQGNALGPVLSRLRAGIVSLREAPGEALLQGDVVTAAAAVAERFRDISGTLGTVRQEAQEGMVAEVERLNGALRDVARLNRLIRVETTAGRASADLEDRRDLAIGRLAESLTLRVLPQTDGGVMLVARGGVVLPMDEDSGGFSIAMASVGPLTYHGPGGALPGVMLDGTDVTGRLVGGRLAELVRLRDATLPRYQAELDQAAAHVAARFEAQGLRLFTDETGAVPDVSLPYPGGPIAGFASAIRVNPAVQAAPRLVRDGTHAVAGSATGATAFDPNPAGGPANYATLLDRVLGFTFSAMAAEGVAQPGLAETGLGPDGALASPLSGTATLESYAARLTASQTAERAAAAALSEEAATLRDGILVRISEQSGVNVDREMAAMVELQNSYAANARVLSTLQQMWDTLLGAVR